LSHSFRMSPNSRVGSGAAAIFGGFAILYASLRSKDIFATDGAHRCLEVFRRQTIFFHENNHMLYPVNVLLWTRLAVALGMKPNGPFEFYTTVELMNCFAAAATLAIIFVLIYMTVSSWKLSLGIVVALGLSRAFFAQATNSNEAVVGLFWSLTAVLILVVALRTRSVLLIFASGLLFSLSMATYESMIFLAPAGLVMIWQAHALADRKPQFSRHALVSEAAFVLGCSVAWLGVHGLAAWMTGNTRPAEMVKQLFRMQDARSYIGLGPGRALNLVVGMVRNIYPVLNNFDGFRHVLTGSKISLFVFLSVFTFFCAFLFFCGLHLWRHWAGMSEPLRTGLLAALTGLLLTLIPPLIWDPQYEKLWLQPLVMLAFLIAIALKIPADRAWESFLICRVAPVVLLAGTLFNFWPVLSGRRADLSAYFQDAQDISEKVGGDDLVVADWGKVSVLYGEVWARKDRSVDFITQAVYYGKGATQSLREDVLETERRGGRVYFLGLLDQSEPEWNSFLGSRCGVPMSDIEPYREHSHVIASYRIGSAATSLRQLDTSFHD
jgi:hypothetical protein